MSENLIVLDLRDPETVLVRLEDALRLMVDDGPVSQADYLFSGQLVDPREHLRLPPGVAELVIELADAVANSGPAEIGLPVMDWTVAFRVTKEAVTSLGGELPNYVMAKRALTALRPMYESMARRQEGRPNMWDRMPGQDWSLTLDEVGVDLAPGERLLFAWRTPSGPIVIATDRALQAVEPTGGVPRLLWSETYPNVSSLMISRPWTLRIAPPFLAWRGYEMNVSVRTWKTKLDFGDDRLAATVIADIWAARRSKP